jgi:hypothetical protein
MELENTNGMRRQNLALVTAAALALSGAGWSGGAFGNEDPRTAEQPSEIPVAEQPSGNIAERADEQAERTTSGVDESVPAAAEGAGGNAAPAGDGTADNAQRAAVEAGKQPPQASEQPAQAGEQPQQAGDGGAASARSVPAPGIPQGAEAKEADDAEGIRHVLATSAQAALTKGGFDDLVELVDADRNRLGEAMPKDEQLKVLDGRIEQIRQAWKDKYGEDFGMNAGAVFAPDFIGVAQGEVEDPPLLARNWPVPPTQGGTTEIAGGTQIDAPGAVASTSDPAQANTDPTDAARPASASEGGALGESEIAVRNLDNGRDVGLVRVPAGDGLPELTVSLIHEKPDAWRIDIPDHLRAPRLHDNLLNHLTKVAENAANWPADKNEAYRLVSHHVLMALLDVGTDSSPKQ